MSDIVERLRDVRWIAPNVSEAKAEATAKDAADEIERLREALQAIVDWDDNYDFAADMPRGLYRKAKAALESAIKKARDA
jgi:hypothetical protein